MAGTGMLERVHGKGADDAGQGGKRSRHDISLARDGGFSRMDKLSAKMAGFATVRYEALAGRVRTAGRASGRDWFSSSAGVQ